MHKKQKVELKRLQLSPNKFLAYEQIFAKEFIVQILTKPGAGLGCSWGVTKTVTKQK